MPVTEPGIGIRFGVGDSGTGVRVVMGAGVALGATVGTGTIVEVGDNG